MKCINPRWRTSGPSEVGASPSSRGATTNGGEEALSAVWMGVADSSRDCYAVVRFALWFPIGHSRPLGRYDRNRSQP
jgi:hypothetical protein